MDTTLNNKAAATINLRAKPLPPFADGKWVEIQIRVNAPNKQQQIAGYLAARHNHWQGDEQDSAFYDKVAADLAIPGFIDDVMKGAGDKNKKPKKPPFWFILERFIHAGGGQKKESFHESYSCAIAAAKQKEDWDNFRDFAFFAALWLREPEKVIGDIRNTPAESELSEFLGDFARKNNEARKQQSLATADTSRTEWRTLLSAVSAALKDWALEDPDPAIAAKIHDLADSMEHTARKYLKMRAELQKTKTTDALKAAAKSLSPVATTADIIAVRDALLQCAEYGNSKANPLDITTNAEALAKLAAKAQQQNAADNTNYVSTLAAEVRESAGKLLKLIGAQTDLPPEEEVLPPPPPPPVPLPEQQPPPPKKTPPVKTEAQKRADKINATAINLILLCARDDPTPADNRVNVAKVDFVNSGFEPAYRVVLGGEKQLPDGDFIFPAAALRLLALPELGARQESLDALDAAIKRGVGEVGRMAVFAAALFPAVFFYDAREFFRDNGPLTDCGKRLEPLRKLVCDFGTWRVSPAVFAAAARGDGPTARAQLQIWYDTNKDKTIKYAGATHIWHEWMKPEGALGAMILPILKGGDREKVLAAAEVFSHDYRNDKAVQRLMDAGSQHFAEKKIEGGAKQRMFELFRDGAILIEKSAEELRHHGDDESGDGGEELREKCQHFHAGLQRAADAQKPQNTDDQTRAAEECLRHAFSFFAADKAADTINKADNPD